MWGEPVTVGYQRELDRMRSEVGGFISAIKQNAYLKRRLESELSGVRNRMRGSIAILKSKVDRLIASSKYQEAQKQLEAATDRITIYLPFYDSSNFKDFNVEVDKRRQKIERAVNLERGRAVRRGIGALRDSITPDYNTLWQAADDLAVKVKNAENVGDGPTLIKKMSGEWAKAHMNGARCQALDRMIAYSLASESDTEEREKWKNKQAALVAAHNKFTDKMANAIVAIIEHDVNRAAFDQIESLYPQYLAAVIPLLRLNDLDRTKSARSAASAKQENFRTRIAAALTQFASKSPALTKSIAEYQSQTSELLAWRRMVANAYAANSEQTFSELGTTLARAAYRSPDMSERLLVDEKAAINTLAIQTFARVPLNYLAERVAGTKVFARNGIGSRTDKKYMLLTRLASRHYTGFVGNPAWISDAVAQLESDLLVDGQSDFVPLTLDAYLALATARSGDLASFGGRISAVMLESPITRPASLTSSDWGMLRIGHLYATKQSRSNLTKAAQDQLKQAQIRVALRPLWLRHEYFFVNVPGNGD